jgi:hypothetical protein
MAVTIPTSPSARLASRALYEAKMLVARYPSLAMPAAKARGHGVLAATGTDVVIEGYPRSANSFSVAAFGMAQEWSGRARPEIAHHTHAPAHVIAAVRQGIPALVLIRDPEDAVLEFVMVKPSITVRQALRGYVRFYGPLPAYRDGFVVGRFEEVTSDFGAVMRRVNDRFGTAFVPFPHTPGNEQACFDAMDGYWRDMVGPGEKLERRVGRPSAWREEEKERLRPAYRAPALAAVRAAAARIHATFPAGGVGSA